MAKKWPAPYVQPGRIRFASTLAKVSIQLGREFTREVGGYEPQPFAASGAMKDLPEFKVIEGWDRGDFTEWFARYAAHGAEQIRWLSSPVHALKWTAGQVGEVEPASPPGVVGFEPWDPEFTMAIKEADKISFVANGYGRAPSKIDLLERLDEVKNIHAQSKTNGDTYWSCILVGRPCGLRWQGRPLAELRSALDETAVADASDRADLPSTPKDTL